MGKIIYHYCSANTFKLILESKKMFLSNVETMNDIMEGEWYKKVVYSEIVKYVKDSNDVNRVWAEICYNFVSKYICCFSEDGDILSQWRAYADDGRGFAIGFSIDDMKINRGMPWMNVSSDYSIGICNVIYDIDKQINIVKMHLDDIFNKKDALGAVKLSQYATIFKNPAFQEEKEWRIIHTPIITYNENDLFDIKVTGGVSDCNFRITKFGLSSYFVWDFSKLKASPIKEIVIGPQNMTKDYILRFFLSKLEIKNVNIRKSQASYRS